MDTNQHIESGQIANIRDGYDAWREETRIDIFDESGEPLFCVPRNFNSEQINAAIGAWVAGFNRGRNMGEAEAKGRIRAALGL